MQVNNILWKVIAIICGNLSDINRKISLKRYEVKNFHFDKNVKVK